MAGATLMFAGASAALDLMGGLFGYLSSKETAAAAESRGRMLRLEAETDAQRYAEQARGFTATQSLAYLKSGVKLTGSPLDVLDKDMLTAAENISAIRARVASGQLEQENIAGQARAGGRAALVSGISSGIGKIAWASYLSDKTKDAKNPTNDTPTGYNGGGGLRAGR